VEELVGSQSKKIQNERREAPQPSGEVPVQEEVEPAPETNRPIRSLLDPPSIPIGEADRGLSQSQIKASASGHGSQDIGRNHAAFGDSSQRS
jgi:hypothetical protein